MRNAVIDRQASDAPVHYGEKFKALTHIVGAVLALAGAIVVSVLAAMGGRPVEGGRRRDLRRNAGVAIIKNWRQGYNENRLGMALAEAAPGDLARAIEALGRRRPKVFRRQAS